MMISEARMTAAQLQEILDRAVHSAPDADPRAGEDRRALLACLRMLAWQRALPHDLCQVDWQGVDEDEPVADA